MMAGLKVRDGVSYKEGMNLLDVESSDEESHTHFNLELKGPRKKIR